ncbi:hypothetical protein J3E69DRAFT_336495 [Trichoderma sp. SZMC 28015]
MLALRANRPLESNLLLYLSYVLLAYTSFGSWKGKNIGERGNWRYFLQVLQTEYYCSFFPGISFVTLCIVG